MTLATNPTGVSCLSAVSTASTDHVPATANNEAQYPKQQDSQLVRSAALAPLRRT
jgi:hypothetical protein